MDFISKQFDGPYEVAEIRIKNKNQLFRGIVYFPPVTYKKPYPVVIYFHGFPQIFAFNEIVKNYNYLLDIGYAFIVFNFRGYHLTEGTVSLSNQTSDGVEILKFVEELAKHNIFDGNNVNIIAHDFGAYISLVLASKTNNINRLLLITPILDLKKHVESEEFLKVLHYINRFLPGNVRGIENTSAFIDMTKAELEREEFQIEKVVQRLQCKRLKIISGGVDKITTPTEILKIFQNSSIAPEIFSIECMDHECNDENDIEKIKVEIKEFLKV